MIESVMETLLVERAVSRGWVTKKLSFIGERGAPDRLFAKDGRIEFVELKRPGEEASRNQQRVIREFAGAGIHIHVIDNLKDGYALLDS